MREEGIENGMSGSRVAGVRSIVERIGQVWPNESGSALSKILRALVKRSNSCKAVTTSVG